MPKTNVDKVQTQYRNFNDWLRGERKHQKKRQKEVAEYLGISQSQYSKRESGEVEWSFREFLKLLELFNTEVKEVI